jgi:hypothetical protein
MTCLCFLKTSRYFIVMQFIIIFTNFHTINTVHKKLRRVN